MYRHSATLLWRCFNVGYWRCINVATLKIRRRILFHFQRQINVISTLIHNVETTLIRLWNVGCGFIDNIFFIWTGNNDSLDHSIFFTQNYSKSKNMKYKSKFQIHLFTNEVHFLDATVFFKTWKIKDDAIYWTHKFSLLSKYLIFPSIKCSKHYPEKTAYSIATCMLTKIGLPLETVKSCVKNM